jgi:hypothetical protein
MGVTMELGEAIKCAGRPYIIKDCSRNNLPDFFNKLGYTVGAEIGVLNGEFSEVFCKAGIKMYSIDPWMAYKGAGSGLSKQEVQDEVYSNARKRLDVYGELSVILRKTSEEALREIADGSLDFVYIDGNHIFPYMAFDLYNWSNKVRKGGIVSGHDYFNKPHHPRATVHVKAVVDAYVDLFGITNWWVIEALSRKDMISNGDQYPSWMWFKP